MVKKIYLLRRTSAKTCTFIEKYSEGKTSMMGRAMRQNWKPFDNYQPIILELYRNDKGQKNYQFDIANSLGPFFIFSELALTTLSHVFEPRGQILPVITESKRKKFFGYYPTNPLANCFDKEKSDYRIAEKGLLVNKPVLIAENIMDDYLFSIEEDIYRVFVTEKFKQEVEKAGLVGFDFSVEIETS